MIDAALIIKRAAEGGAFEGLSQKEAARVAEGLVGELPDGLKIVDGWAEAVRNGWGLAGKLGGRIFLARRR